MIQEREGRSSTGGGGYFASNFEALTGHAPLPWQVRLFRRLSHSTHAELPSRIDLPTGAGKTSSMVVWLLALARSHALPRRLAFIVDRRAVADQASEVAQSLADRVPEHLRKRLPGGVLRVSTLRGRKADNREWMKDPSCAAIIVGTVDMIGSRLLCQGYGMSRHMRPVAAGLLGTDTWVVLDEAHLSAPFHRLLQGIEKAQAEHPQIQLPRPSMRLTAMSATLGRNEAEDASAAFRLNEADLSHPVIKQRMDAVKQMNLMEGEASPLAMAEEAVRLANLNGGSRVLVYCNLLQSKDEFLAAQSVFKEVGKLMGKQHKGNVLLLVGQRRIRERAKAMRDLKRLGFVGGQDAARVPTVVVATSAGEVGVDMDADHMVCDVVPWERMLQRLGRVNRMGGDGRRSIISIMQESGDAFSTTKKRLQFLDFIEGQCDGRWKESAAVVKAWLGKKDNRPGLASDVVHEATKCLCNLPFDAESGIKWKGSQKKEMEAAADDLFNLLHNRKRASMSVLNHISEQMGGDLSIHALRRIEGTESLAPELAMASTDEPMHPALGVPELDEWFASSLPSKSCRPLDLTPWLRGHEAADEPAPLSLVWRKHLPSLGEAKDFFGQARPHLDELLEANAKKAHQWLVKLSMQDPLVPQEQNAAYLKKPGEGWIGHPQNKLGEVGDKGGMLVLDRRLGGLDLEGLFDSKATEAKHPDAKSEHDGGPIEDLAEDRADLPFYVCKDDDEFDAPDGWTLTGRFGSEAKADEDGGSMLLVLRRDSDQTEKARDFGSVSRAMESLEDHHNRVASEADRISESLGLAASERRMLWESGALHDGGKIASVWQRAMGAPEGTPCAKTKGPCNPGMLGGFRHEGLSARMMLDGVSLLESDPGRSALARHIVAAHHGRCRPFLDYAGDDSGSPRSVVATQHAQMGLDYIRLQETWGHWGLAWWEALLRCADISASALGEHTTLRPIPERNSAEKTLPAPGTRMQGGEFCLKVDMNNPGEMLAALGFAELASMLRGGAEAAFEWEDVGGDALFRVATKSGDPLQAVMGFIGMSGKEGCAAAAIPPLALANGSAKAYSSFAPYAFPNHINLRDADSVRKEKNWPVALTTQGGESARTVIDHWAARHRWITTFWFATSSAVRRDLFQRFIRLCRQSLETQDVGSNLLKLSVSDKSAAAMQFHPRPRTDALGWSPNKTKLAVKTHEHHPWTDLLASVAMNRMSPRQDRDVQGKLHFGFIANSGLMPLPLHRIAMRSRWHPFKRSPRSLRRAKTLFDWACAEMTTVVEGKSAKRVIGWQWIS